MSGERLLRLVGEPAEQRPTRLFCGHCAAQPAVAPSGGLDARVCEHCSLGLLLEAEPAMVPHPDDPFLVADAGQTVCALSRRAESLLGVAEPDAVNRRLSDFIVPADLGGPAALSLSAAIVAAATGAPQPVQVAVRPPDVFGVRHWARIGSCGPPSAALLVIAAVE
jgi:PAS domain-containing protein